MYVVLKLEVVIISKYEKGRMSSREACLMYYNTEWRAVLKVIIISLRHACTNVIRWR